MDFVTEPHSGKRLVDYIGRFETLEKDIAIVQEHLHLGRRAFSIRIRLSAGRAKTTRVYYDEEAVNLVVNYFGADLKQFGYRFNGFAGDMPIMQGR